MTKEQADFCSCFYDETGIDLAYIVENDEPSDIDELMEALEEQVNEIEVIYYHNAIEYLSENDPSLQESLGLAGDLGYTVENINSELLATLLKQEDVRGKLGEYRDDIEALFFTV